jgi:hypothetical protein
MKPGPFNNEMPGLEKERAAATARRNIRSQEGILVIRSELSTATNYICLCRGL